MPISYAQVSELQCPQCGALFSAEVWLIIDAGERPDMLALCSAGKIHHIPCPQGHISQVSAPLLLHWPEQKRLIFSPAQQTEMSDGRIKDLLTTYLRSALTDGEGKEYLSKIENIDRENLPTVLAGESDREASLKALTEEIVTFTRLPDMSRRAQLCRQALNLIMIEKEIELWAALQCELGNSLLQDPMGDRAENLEGAIQAYEAAIRVRTKDISPTEWARTQSNLGIALANRIRGDRVENLERAIKAYTDALTVHTLNSDPMAWATNQLNLGAALVNRIAGSRVENLERAIRAYEAALTVFKREVSPADWAAVQNNLANAYSERLAGDKSDNLERAITAGQASLTVYNPTEFPEEWATAWNNLGNIYHSRIQGERAENLEQAIEAYKAALTIYTREAYPADWAMAWNNLGNAYTDRIRGERAENLEHAIQAYESSLSVYTRESFPEQWAGSQYNLGVALLNRIYGNRTENLERALQCHKAALTVYTREAFPIDWARAQDGIGSVYRERIRGERAENIECAIEAHQAALLVRTRAEFPLEWAMIQNNLGNAYRSRLRGNTGDNLELAIKAYQAVLTTLTRSVHAEMWAVTQHNLSVAYANRITGNVAEDIERAIKGYEAALTIYTRDSFPLDWAMTQSNLGNAYTQRVKGSRADNLGRAVEAYRAALMVRTRETAPLDWAMTQSNLALVLADCAQGEHMENRRIAIQLCQAALEVFRADVIPKESRTVASNMARLYIEQQDWEQAYAALLIAIDSAERLYAAALTEEGRTAEIEENARIYQLTVAVCLRLSPPRLIEAFLHMEEGRSRLLRDQISDIYLPAPPVAPDLLKQESELLQTTRNLDHAIRTLTNEAERRRLVNEAQASRTQLEEVWNTLAEDAKAQSYVAIRRGERIKWETITDWIDAQTQRIALLEFYTLGEEIIAYILRKDAEPRVVQIEVPSQQLEACILQLFRELQEFNPERPAREEWHGLTSNLLDNVMPHLDGAELVYIIPHGLLHRLPLHAVEYQSRPLIDYFPISYAPSAAILTRLTHTPTSYPRVSRKGHSSEQALVIGNPTCDLPFAEIEALQVAKHSATTPLTRDAATKTRVQKEMAGRDIIHISTHAYYDARDPLASGILLADGEVLTAREILGNPIDARLIVLNGCQTGMQKIGIGDELTGLGRAFLYAGIPTILLNLWSVNDYASAVLMSRFYNWLFKIPRANEISTAEALRKAMLEVRDDLPHTFYWASFMLFGIGGDNPQNYLDGI